MNKAIDIVRPEPKTALEAWERWMNMMESKLRLLPYAGGRKIEVK